MHDELDRDATFQMPAPFYLVLLETAKYYLPVSSKTSWLVVEEYNKAKFCHLPLKSTSARTLGPD